VSLARERHPHSRRNAGAVLGQLDYTSSRAAPPRDALNASVIVGTGGVVTLVHPSVYLRAM